MTKAQREAVMVVEMTTEKTVVNATATRLLVLFLSGDHCNQQNLL